MEVTRNMLQRMREFRSKGRRSRAFFFAYGTWVGIACFVVVTAAFHMYNSYREKSIADEGARVNQHLENVEVELRFAISTGDRAKALELVGQLSHPLHERWKDQSKWNEWYGYPYYSDWWSMKREEYKDRIMALPTQHPPSAYPPMVHLDGTDQYSSVQRTVEKYP